MILIGASLTHKDFQQEIDQLRHPYLNTLLVPESQRLSHYYFDVTSFDISPNLPS